MGKKPLKLCRHGKRTYYHNRYVDGVHLNGNLLAKRGNCFNKTIVENYNEIPCVSGKRTVQLSSIKNYFTLILHNIYT